MKSCQHPTPFYSISVGLPSRPRLGCRAESRSPAEHETAILDSSRERPFRSGPLASDSAPHLQRGSMGPVVADWRQEGEMKNKTEGRNHSGTALEGSSLRANFGVSEGAVQAAQEKDKQQSDPSWSLWSRCSQRCNSHTFVLRLTKGCLIGSWKE